MTARSLRGFFAILSAVGLAACGANSANEAMPPATDLDRSATLAATCSGCHAGPETAMISLDGLSKEVLSDAMHRYKSELDGTTVMHRLARGYTDADIDAVSTYLAASAEVE